MSAERIRQAETTAATRYGQLYADGITVDGRGNHHGDGGRFVAKALDYPQLTAAGPVRPRVRPGQYGDQTWRVTGYRPTAEEVRGWELGPVQRYVLLILADGQARTVDRIETDALMTPGRAYGALDGHARRGQGGDQRRPPPGADHRRVGPWRCPDCSELVRGGQRAPHRRETHGETTYRPSRIAWAWAGPDPEPAA